MIKNRRFRAKCVLCDFVSKPNAGAVFAGWDGLRHGRYYHPDADGLVAVIIEEKKESKEKTT